MMSKPKEVKYKFTRGNELYYATKERNGYVEAYSSSEDLYISKSELMKEFEQGKVEFFCETGPDFIKEEVTA